MLITYHAMQLVKDRYHSLVFAHGRVELGHLRKRRLVFDDDEPSADWYNISTYAIGSCLVLGNIRGIKSSQAFSLSFVTGPPYIGSEMSVFFIGTVSHFTLENVHSAVPSSFWET